MKFWCAIVSAFLVSQSVLAQSTPANETSQVRFAVERYTLPNGLTVILQPDNTVPTIAYHTWFRVGSKNEQVGTTGIAHLFEHLMFMGSQKYDGKQYDLLLQSNGAVNNAFTSHDYTGYYVNLPSSKLELVVDMESDRMVKLQLNQANLDSEREVVKEERRMRVDNSPIGVLNESIFATAYKVHPYRWPVIGYMKDLNGITVEKAQEFYRTYYAPNNAVIVIAGDFKPSQAKKLIEKYYGGLKSQPIPKLDVPAEPEQKVQRETTVRRKFQNVIWSVSYPLPAAGHEDNYALDLISNILGRGASSRLHKRLVYELQIATKVMANAYMLQHPGLFQVMVALKPGADMQKVQDVVYNQIWRLRTQLIDDKELTKAKNQTMKDFVDSLKTSQGRAQSLALNETVYGSYEHLFSDLERYNAVTKEKIQEVANKYLNQQQRNIVRLQPPEESPAQPAPSAEPAKQEQSQKGE